MFTNSIMKTFSIIKVTPRISYLKIIIIARRGGLSKMKSSLEGFSKRKFKIFNLNI
jgi:hypothetical protein